MAKFKTGDKVIVRSSRKGLYKATVAADFDTLSDEWYSVTLRQDILYGMVNEWVYGDSIPCRRGIDIVMLDIDEEDEDA
jgi:hypothetical protein